MASHKLPPDVRAALQELKESLLHLYGERLKGVSLFGSYARGDYHPESDVDVLIVLAGQVRAFEEISRYSKAISDICLRHDVLISTVPVSEQWVSERLEPLFENVRREGVAL